MDENLAIISIIYISIIPYIILNKNTFSKILRYYNYNAGKKKTKKAFRT